MGTVEEAKALVCDLCRNLYAGGHVSGTGGGISIRVGEAIVMAPSGVQKERMEAQDMFVLDARGGVVHTPEARPPPYKAPKLSECAPLFMSVRLRAVAAGGGGGVRAAQRWGPTSAGPCLSRQPAAGKARCVPHPNPRRPTSCAALARCSTATR